MNKKNNRKGFTIVELVIVIAVIAILATVLVPTFGTIISDAKDTADVQEAKNLYTNYVATTAKTGEYADNAIVAVDSDSFVAIVNGAVVDEVYTTAELAKAAWGEGKTVTLGTAVGKVTPVTVA